MKVFVFFLIFRLRPDIWVQGSIAWGRSLRIGMVSVGICDIMVGNECHYSDGAAASADNHWRKHGRFGTVPQHPAQPTERIYCSTLSQCPRRKV